MKTQYECARERGELQLRAEVLSLETELMRLNLRAETARANRAADYARFIAVSPVDLSRPPLRAAELDSFQFLPAGRHRVNLGVSGPARRAVEIDVLIEPATAETMRDQLAIIRASYRSVRPFIDMFHEGKVAAFWPETFYFSESPRPGVYVAGQWSEAGRAAVEGCNVRGFSPQFHVDNVRGKPARMKASADATPNMGGLTNIPAFFAMGALWDAPRRQPFSSPVP